MVTARPAGCRVMKVRIRSWRLHRGLTLLAGGCVAALVIVAVVLYLIPVVAPPPKVTVDHLDWTIAQGTWKFNNKTEPWFVEQYINQSGPASGYPFQVGSGKTFNTSLVLVEFDPSPVAVCTITVAPPLEVVSTFPALPAPMEGGEDNLLQITILVDAPAGAVINGVGEINSVGCAVPPF